MIYVDSGLSSKRPVMKQNYFDLRSEVKITTHVERQHIGKMGRLVEQLKSFIPGHKTFILLTIDDEEITVTTDQLELLRPIIK